VTITASLFMWSSAPARAVAALAALAWPKILWVQVAEGFTKPVHIQHAGDGSSRLFVVEQGGIVRIVEAGTVAPTPFLDLSPTGADRVLSDSFERGLLSIAFPPGFPGLGQDHVYVVYSTNDPEGAGDPIEAGDFVLERYGLTADPNLADPDNRQLVLTISHQASDIHYGGQMAFGPADGYLYVSTGDGGPGGDPQRIAQDPAKLLGKILRIDVEASGVPTYTVPATNPYTATVGFQGEIWALGLRNPWRFSFDRQTHDLYIADVGQSQREEVNHQAADSPGGENYGWKCYESVLEFDLTGCGPIGNYIFPIVDYAHPLGCSVSGGFVYRGLTYEPMQGIYFFGDYCFGRIWGLQRDGLTWQVAELVDTPFKIPTFGEDESGEIYIADHTGGRVYRLVAADHFYYFPLAAKN
jgi:hypothetical protein